MSRTAPLLIEIGCEEVPAAHMGIVLREIGDVLHDTGTYTMALQTLHHLTRWVLSGPGAEMLIERLLMAAAPQDGGEPRLLHPVWPA